MTISAPVQEALVQTGYILTKFAENAGITFDEADRLLRFTQLHQFYVWLEAQLTARLKVATGTERAELTRQQRIAQRQKVKYETAVSTIRALTDNPPPDFAMPHLVAWAGEVVS